MAIQAIVPRNASEYKFCPIPIAHQNGHQNVQQDGCQNTTDLYMIIGGNRESQVTKALEIS